MIKTLSLTWRCSVLVAVYLTQLRLITTGERKGTQQRLLNRLLFLTREASGEAALRSAAGAELQPFRKRLVENNSLTLLH